MLTLGPTSPSPAHELLHVFLETTLRHRCYHYVKQMSRGVWFQSRTRVFTDTVSWGVGSCLADCEHLTDLEDNGTVV